MRTCGKLAKLDLLCMPSVESLMIGLPGKRQDRLHWNTMPLASRPEVGAAFGSVDSLFLMICTSLWRPNIKGSHSPCGAFQDWTMRLEQAFLRSCPR
jgi:hypothetical protein